MTDIEYLLSTLGLKHPLERSTCIGYGQRKPDCGCAVAIASRSAAYDILHRIDQDLRHKIDTTNGLYHVASLLLCKRWHQFQAAENVARWQRRLEAYSTTPRTNPMRSTHATPIRPTASIDSNRRPTLYIEMDREDTGLQYARSEADKRREMENMARRCSSEVLMKELKRRVDTGRYPNLSAQLLDLANELFPLEDDFSPVISATPRSSNLQPQRGLRVEESHTTTLSPVRPLLLTAAAATVSSVSSPSAPATSRSSPSSQSSTASHPRRTVQQAEPLRQSHLECLVCMEPPDSNGGGQWECSQCKNRVHQECFDAWFASQANAGQTVGCVYCRTPVSRNDD